MLLIKSQHLDELLSLDELVRYALTPVPHSLGTAHGFFNKTNKAAMLHFVMEIAPEDVPYPTNSFYIPDGNALFHALTSLPPTFGAICLKVLDKTVCRSRSVKWSWSIPCLIYGHVREKSINSVRSTMLKKMVGEDEQLTVKCKVDLSRLPPCRDNLVPYIWRVKWAEKADFWRPKAYDPGQGWQKTEEGILESVWSCGPVLPPSLIDLLEKTNEQEWGRWRSRRGGVSL